MPVRRTTLAVSLVVLGMAAAALAGDGQAPAATLNDAGWKALRNGYGARAEALFNEALTYEPDNPVLLFGAGSALHVQGKQRDAMARLTRAVEIDPGATAAARLLGRIAFDEGEVDRAIRTYENALKRAPGDAALARQLEDWRREAAAHGTFEARRYDRFRVMFEGRAEESLAAQATAVLDRAFYRIGDKLGEFPAQTIVTILYTEKQFRDITRAPEWSVGLYDGRIRVPAAGAARDAQLFENVLVHELCHAIVATIAPRAVPGWLHEGLAQYFEGSDREAAQLRMKALGRSIPLKQLQNGFGRMSAAAAQVAYDESLLAVAVMMDRPGFGWGRLLHRLADGETFEEAIPNFGFSYADLEAPFTKRP